VASNPVVVTCAADLASAPRREHSDCYVVKPHGDYLQETIRNTPAELAELQPEMAAELAEIFGCYGVVVLGYSGSPALGPILRCPVRKRVPCPWDIQSVTGTAAIAPGTHG